MPTPHFTSISDIDWSKITDRSFTPSPSNRQDQVMYMLMVDRFSDGRESERELYRSELKDELVADEVTRASWQEAGAIWCGGNLRGITAKLDYLSELGITTLWLSPVLQQCSFDQTSYHGYGAQNFLAVDSHFGTTEDLVALVDAAHQKGLYVILDIVFNHAGNVFSYDVAENSETAPGFNRNGQWPVSDWLEKVLPVELQSFDLFHLRGVIEEWEDPEQYKQGDFKLLKSFVLSEWLNSQWQPAPALRVLTDVYKYWLAVADLDGYRIDAVKHMEPEATAYFTQTIKQFARELGKDNFWLIGEIPGGQQAAQSALKTTGLDAALGLLDIPDQLENFIKGEASPSAFFDNFSSKELNLLKFQRSSEMLNQVQHDAMSKVNIRWQANQIVILIDDHDQIRKNFDKARFAATIASRSEAEQLQFLALATLTTTSGIPCIYYGSEQALDGQGDDDDYIRECLFGGDFGPFRSSAQAFSQQSFVYRQLAQVLQLRKQYSALRTGQQQLLKISGNGRDFGYPEKFEEKMKSLVAWLRWDEKSKIICILNTDREKSVSAWIEIDSLNQNPSQPHLLFSATNQLQQQSYTVDRSAENTLFCQLPALGFAIAQL